MLIQKYQPIWVENFNQIKLVLEKTLGNLDIKIEHVGSTSIPNLDAKPIIDIDIVFYKNIDFNDIKICLDRIGYYHNGDQGIKDREVFKRKNSSKNHYILDSISHHLYACPVHSEELQRHLIFRNFLRENEIEKKNYQKLKYQIAEETNQDKKKYAEVKQQKVNPWINSIIEKARGKFE